MDSLIFTAPDAWKGGGFDVLMYLGNVSTESTQRAVDALWMYPDLDGCWLDPNVEPSPETRIQPVVHGPEETPPFRGIARLPNATRCACSASFVWDEHGVWLYFGLPCGSLGMCYDIGAYPFEPCPLNEADVASWVLPLSDWLAHVAAHVHSAQPVLGGMTGFITAVEVDKIIKGKSLPVPQERWHGYLRREGSEFAWYPPNTFDAPCVERDGS